MAIHEPVEERIIGVLPSDLAHTYGHFLEIQRMADHLKEHLFEDVRKVMRLPESRFPEVRLVGREDGTVDVIVNR